MNTFGNLFRLTDFGESHGSAIGGVVDGMPSGIQIDFESIRHQLSRRRTGASPFASQRKEDDEVVFLSGIFDGVTTGAPIGFTIANNDARSKDYDNLKQVFRPCHADYTYHAKYGHRDYRGGGRASARETAVRVVAGALAMNVLKAHGISIVAYTSRIGSAECRLSDYPTDSSQVDSSVVRCPDKAVSQHMEAELAAAREARDTLGGVVTCVIRGVPAGLGEPVFGKLSAMLAYAMMGINAAKGFDYGDGFDAASMRGSQSIDAFCKSANGDIVTTTNHSGGIQGGISNGNDIVFRVAFKPVATMPAPVPVIDAAGNESVLEVHGRHDICVVPRAVPVVEAMAAITLLDAMMMNAGRKL